MARDVTVRLSADIGAYVQAMGQAEQATSRVAEAADRLGEISITADSSVASDLDQAASSADNAASSMEAASGAAEGMSGGMDSASASAQNAAGGIDSAGTSAEVLSSNLDGSGASSHDFAASLSTVGAQSQDAAGSMLAVSGAAQDASGGMQAAGSAADDVAGSLQAASAAGQDAGAGIEAVGASAQSAAAGIDSISGAAQSASGSMESASGAAQSAAGSMESIGGASQSAAAGLDSVDGSAQSAAAGMDNAAGASEGLLSAASGMNREFAATGAAVAVVGGGLSAIAGSLIGTGIEYNNLQQVSTQALSVMTDSASDAAAQMDRFDDFARTSPFFRDSWLEAQRQLMAFGMEADRVVPTMEGIEEAVAAIGGGDQEIRRLVDILGQVEGQGRITGRELQRMGQMGIDAAAIMGTQLGMTGDEIREQITAGAIDAQTAIDALAAGMSEQFEGSSDAIRNTFEGAKNDVIAFVRDIGSIIAAPLVNPEGGGFLVDIMNMAGDALLSLRDLPDPLIQIAGLGAAAAGGIGLLGGAMLTAAPLVTPFLNNVKETYTTLGNLVTGAQPVPRSLRRIGAAAGIAAAGLGLIAAANWAWDEILPDAQTLEETERGLRNLANVGEYSGSVYDFGEAWESLNTTGNKVRQNVPGWAAVLMDGFGAGNSSVALSVNAVQNLSEEFEHVDSAIAGFITNGNVAEAASGIEMISEQMLEAGHSSEDILEAFPQIAGALTDAAQAADVNVSSTRLLEIATSEAALAALHAGEDWSTITRAYEDNYYAATDAGDGAISFRDALSQQAEATSEASEGLQDLLGNMSEYAGIALDAEATTDQWIADMQELNAALDEGELSLDANTESGRENRAMLRGMAEDVWSNAAALAEQGGSLEEVQGGIDDYIDALRRSGEQAGLTESEIDDMIRTYLGFNEVEPIEVQAENRAQEIFDEVEDGLNSLPDDFQIWLEAQDERAQETIAALLEGDYEAVADITGDDALAQAVIEAFESGDYRAVAELIAEDDRAREVIYDFQAGEYVAQVDILGNDDPARQVVAAIMNGDYQALVDILGGEDQATATIEAIQNGDYQALVDAVGGEDRATEVLNLIANDDYIAQVVAEALSSGAEGELNETSRDRSSMITGFPIAEGAEAVLNETSRQRIADILADPDAWNAEGTLNDTARQRIADILADSHTGIAESDLNGAARQRIADILAEPNTYNAEGQLTSTARQRIADILAQPSTWNAESSLNNTARDRQATITAVATGIASARAAIVSGVSGITARIGSVFSGSSGGRAGGAMLPAYSTGGRLGHTGLATDSILGISRSGTPTAWVDDREWIINRRSSDLHNGLLAAINANNIPAIKSTVAGYAVGGVAGGYRPREFPAQPSSQYQAQQIAAAMQGTTRGGTPGVSIGEITAVGGDTQQVVNRVGDEIFRRLRQEGVPVGTF